MNNYVRTGLDRANVERYEFVCKYCASINLLYYSTPNSDTSGAHCAACKTVVWFNSRLSNLLREHHDSDRDGEYKEWHFNKIKNFLSSLPPCPQCNEISFDEFRTAVASSPFLCYACDSVHSDQLRNTTKMHLSDRVWWLSAVP